jgi:hypothetical protein
MICFNLQAGFYSLSFELSSFIKSTICFNLQVGFKSLKFDCSLFYQIYDLLQFAGVLRIKECEMDEEVMMQMFLTNVVGFLR